MRLFDLVISEGSQIVYKIGLAVLNTFSKALRATKSKSQFLSVLQASTIALHDTEAIIQAAMVIEYKGGEMESTPEKVRKEVGRLRAPNIPYYYRPKVVYPSTIIENQEVCFSEFICGPNNGPNFEKFGLILVL